MLPEKLYSPNSESINQNNLDPQTKANLRRGISIRKAELQPGVVPSGRDLRMGIPACSASKMV